MTKQDGILNVVSNYFIDRELLVLCDLHYQTTIKTILNLTALRMSYSIFNKCIWEFHQQIYTHTMNLIPADDHIEVLN